MSDGNSKETMKIENYFCSICLRTKAEVKLDPISTKMYQMFFIGLAKCVDSNKVSRNLCVWCRQRVINALKLVETAEATDRILETITKIDNSHCQSSKQIFWDQIQAIKRSYGLTPRTSRVISYSLPPNISLSLPVKLEHEDGFSREEGNTCLDSAINEDKVNHNHKPKKIDIEILSSTQVMSGKLSPDARIGLSVKLEHEDGFSGEEQNVCLNRVINDGKLDDKGSLDLERHNFLDLKPEPKIDDTMSSKLDITRKTPYINEVGHRNKLKSNVVTKAKMNELELSKILHTVVSKVESFDGDRNQKLLSDVVNEDPGLEFGQGVLKNRSQDHGSHVAIEDSGRKSQITYSSADAPKHIRPLQLTEAQRLQELEERKQEARYRSAPFKCELCAFDFSFRKTYETHMERHSESYGSHKCSVCSIYFKDRMSYEQHCKIHNERHECTVCTLTFLHRQEALNHYLSQHTDQCFKCEHCTYEFRTVSVLKVYMKTVHNVEFPFFPCTQCSQVFSTESSYKRHMEQHSSSENGNRSRKRHCSVCSRTFCTAYYLRLHQEMHSKEKTFTCQHCGNGFTSPWGLQLHVNRMHSDVCFECDHCQKTFKEKGDLRKHITWTHLQRGYNCKFCSKVLRSKFHLGQHIKQKHEGWSKPKDKMCDVCGRGFSYNSTLKNHRRIHSMERPYHCTICPDAFKHPFTRKKHMQRVHKIND